MYTDAAVSKPINARPRVSQASFAALNANMFSYFQVSSATHEYLSSLKLHSRQVSQPCFYAGSVNLRQNMQQAPAQGVYHQPVVLQRLQGVAGHAGTQSERPVSVTQ